jgi:polysaccharide biosynthesis protein PslH
MRRLQILWLSHFVPYPPKGGVFQRGYNMIRTVGVEHDIDLIAMKHKRATHPEELTRRAKDELLRHCRTVRIVDISAGTEGLRLAARSVLGLARGLPATAAIFRSKEMRGLVHAAARSIGYDVVHFDTIGLAEYLPCIGELPAVMTHHGAESFMIRRRIKHEKSWARKLFFLLEWLALRRYERRMCPRFGVNVVMSDVDRRIMQEIAPDANYAVVQNGVDLDYFRPGPVSNGHTLIFAGRLDQYSNRDGILHFAEHVWPLIRARHPDAVLQVIGSNPPSRLLQLAATDPAVEVPGFVDDVRPYFSRSTVAICPNRDGGGIRIKILDALAQGMPVVSTSIGVEGIEVTPERDILLADTPAEFALQVSRVFDDEELRKSLASNARKLAERVYSWEALGAKQVAQYRSVILSREQGLPDVLRRTASGGVTR